MNSIDLTTQTQDLTDQTSSAVTEYSGFFGSIKTWIVGQFGEQGFIFACIAVSALVLFIGIKMAKTTFSMITYFLVPAVGLAALGSIILSYSFISLLPVTTIFSAVLLLVKG